MKFIVDRTSFCGKSEDTCPCEGAIQETINNINKWTIEFKTLDELIAFQEKEGTIIINDEYSYSEQSWHKVIEIYDDYRE